MSEIATASLNPTSRAAASTGLPTAFKDELNTPIAPKSAIHTFYDISSQLQDILIATKPNYAREQATENSILPAHTKGDYLATFHNRNYTFPGPQTIDRMFNETLDHLNIRADQLPSTVTFTNEQSKAIIKAFTDHAVDQKTFVIPKETLEHLNFTDKQVDALTTLTRIYEVLTPTALRESREFARYSEHVFNVANSLGSGYTNFEI